MKGTRKLLCVRNKPGKSGFLEVRELSCFCEKCRSNTEPFDCENIGHVNPVHTYQVTVCPIEGKSPKRKMQCYEEDSQPKPKQRNARGKGQFVVVNPKKCKAIAPVNDIDNPVDTERSGLKRKIDSAVSLASQSKKRFVCCVALP